MKSKDSKYRPIVFVSTIFLLMMCVIAVEGNPVIRKIKFYGNESFSDKVLEAQLLINDGKIPVIRRLKRDDFSYYDPQVLQDEQLKIIGFYQRHGFLNVIVETKVLLIGKKEKRVTIEFFIRENDPVLVDKVDLNFLPKKPEEYDREEMVREYRASRKLAPGVRFADEDLLHDQTLIREAANEQGYAYNQINYRLNVDTAAYRTGIQFNFSAGPKCYLGSTTFLLQNREPENKSFLKKYVTYKKGAVFTPSSLEKTQKQIYETGLYNVVSVVPARNIPKTDTIPIEVILRKASPYKVKFGFGYGREERFRGFVDFQYLGFLGGIRRLNLFLKHSYLEPYRVDLKFTQPGSGAFTRRWWCVPI